MKLRHPVKFNELIELVKAEADKEVSYCVYGTLQDSNKITLETICFLDGYPEIDDDDEEIFPDFVTNNRLTFLFREELIQDVVKNALSQKLSASNVEILKAITFYNERDSFMFFE